MNYTHLKQKITEKHFNNLLHIHNVSRHLKELFKIHEMESFAIN